MSPTGFEQIKPECPRLMDALRSVLVQLDKECFFPDLSTCKGLMLTSDYSGDDPRESQRAYSFLLADWTACASNQQQRIALRGQHGCRGRSFEFKSVHRDAPRRRQLESYIETFDGLPGLLVSFVVPATIETLFIDIPIQGDKLHDILQQEGLGSWRPHIAEKMLRVLHFASLLIAGLGRGNQELFWVADQDAITSQGAHLLEALMRVLPCYSADYPRRAMLAPHRDDGDRTVPPEMLFDDLKAIVDLAAGATKSWREWEAGLSKHSEDSHAADRSGTILNWLLSRPLALRKLVVAFESRDEKIGIGAYYWRRDAAGVA